MNNRGKILEEGSRGLRFFNKGSQMELRTDRDLNLELYRDNRLVDKFYFKGDIDESNSSFNSRITNLENNYTVYEVFTYTGTDSSGTLSIPSGAEIFDMYQDGIIDAIVVLADANGNPIEEVSRDSQGNLITVSQLTSVGTYTLSSTPQNNSCVVYYIKINDINKSNVPEASVISSISYANINHENITVGVVDAVVPSFVDHGNGTLTISSCNVGLRHNPSHYGVVIRHIVLQKTLSFTDGAQQYIVARYSNGIAEYFVENDKYVISGSDAFIVYVVWRQGNILHTADQDSIGIGLPNKINSRILAVQPYARSSDGGLIISESTSPVPRTINVSSSVVFKGVTIENVLAFTSSTDMLTLSYRTAGVELYSQTPQYNNTQYQNGANLVTIPTNKYAVRWFFRSIGDVKETFYVLGSGYYNNVAEASLEPMRVDIPLVLRNHCMFVGRSIIQYNATSGITESAFSTSFQGASVIAHNDTSAKQGGTTDEYYHLTSKEYTEEIINRQFGDVINSNYSQFESDGFLKHNGEAMYWKDIDFPIVIRNTGTGIPILQPLIGNITAPQWAVNDFNVCEGQELVHEWAEGTSLHWHIHMITNGLDITNRYVKWEIEYSWVNVDGTLSAPVIQSIEYMIAANTPDRTMRIVSISNFIPSGGKIASHLFARLKRITSTGLAPTDNPFCSMLQCHILCDTEGSRNIGTK